ncbi:MAG: serine/threonine protein kinase [Phycisphaeraceae bacterium]
MGDQHGAGPTGDDPHEADGDRTRPVDDSASSGGGSSVSRLVREAERLRSMDHPAIARVEKIDAQAGTVTFDPEALAGGSLRALLVGGRPLAAERVLSLAVPLADALRYVHDRVGLSRCVVRPDRVVLGMDGAARFTSLGLGRSMPGSVRGDGEAVDVETACCLAPELFEGKAGGTQSDICSFGLLLYEMATGKRPFEPSNLATVTKMKRLIDPEPPAQVHPGIDPGLAAVIEHAIARFPKDRYATMEDLHEDLELLRVGQAPVNVRLPGGGSLSTAEDRSSQPARAAASRRAESPSPPEAPRGTGLGPSATQREMIREDAKPFWALAVVGCYALFALASTILIGVAFSKEDDAPAAGWIVAGIYVLCQLVFVLIPVRVASRRPMTRGKVWLTILPACLLLGLLVTFGGAGFMEMLEVHGAVDDEGEKSGTALFFLFGLLTWLGWTLVFGIASFRQDPASVSARVYRLLLRGSIIELMVAVPCHVIVRQKDECSAGVMTWLGICVGIGVMFLAFGPSVAVLYVRRFMDILPMSERRLTDKDRRRTLRGAIVFALLVIFAIGAWYEMTGSFDSDDDQTDEVSEDRGAGE